MAMATVFAIVKGGKHHKSWCEFRRHCHAGEAARAGVHGEGLSLTSNTASPDVLV
jgi:hypothetical protein